MRIQSFKADSVHGYLDFDIDFNDDLSIILAPNGKGKTTALKIILAIFSRNYSYLKNLSFKRIELNFILSKLEQFYTIVLDEYQMSRTPDGVKLVSFNYSCKEANVHFKIYFRDEVLFSLEALDNSFSEEELKFIKLPMFLSLDRRFIFNDKPQHYNLTIEKYLEKKNLDIRDKEDPLLEVESLIYKEFNAHRITLNQSNKKLRDQLLKILLKDLNLDDTEISIFQIIEAFDKIEKIRYSLNLLNFDNDILELIERKLDYYSSYSKRTINFIEDKKYEELKSDFILDLVNNKKELIQLEQIVDSLTEYEKKQKKSYEKIHKFQNIINNFFEQSGKTLKINMSGKINITLKNHAKKIGVDTLSSGERQLIIILGNLIFNEQITSRKIFIIDEPELSLHISWQRLLIESIITSGTDIQLIVATHSPSIISSYTNKIMSLNKNLISFKENIDQTHGE